MVPVLPMLVPEDIGVEARNDQCGNGHAMNVSFYSIAEARVFKSPRLRALLDCDLAPEVWMVPCQLLHQRRCAIDYAPVVPTACSFTAALSRLKALSSAPLKTVVSELAKRRWRGVRTAGERI